MVTNLIYPHKYMGYWYICCRRPDKNNEEALPVLLDAPDVSDVPVEPVLNNTQFVTKSHRRIKSGDSVMDPLYVEMAFVLHANIVKCLINCNIFVDEISRLGMTCHTAKISIFPLSKWYPYMSKTKSYHSNAQTNILFWQNCTLYSNDIICATQVLHKIFFQLLSLYLNDNRISDEGCITIVNTSKQLRHLSLACNTITDYGAFYIIKHLIYLHELNVRGNNISPSTREKIEKMHVPNKMFIAI